MGFTIDFYCDNNKDEGVVIKDGIVNISPPTLYLMKENVLVFITVWDNIQEHIKKQLIENGIKNITSVDFLFMQNFCNSLLEMKDEKLIKCFDFVLDDEKYLRIRFEAKMGYPLHLEKPLTYNEKLQWLKLHDRKEIYKKMVDKYEVKKYINRFVSDEFIIPTLGVWDEFDKIDFDTLPNKFVLKCTHDTGSVIICKDKKTFDKFKAKDVMESALKRNLYWLGREWPYKDIQPRIIAEKYLEDKSDGELRDYKLFCFHGVVKAMLIATGRMVSDGREACTDFFDEKLKHIDMRSGHPNSLIQPHLPDNYEIMKKIAEKLSSGIPHLRVDFYEVNGRVYIGELTFYHQSGTVAIEPLAKDIEWGGGYI